MYGAGRRLQRPMAPVTARRPSHGAVWLQCSIKVSRVSNAMVSQAFLGGQVLSFLRFVPLFVFSGLGAFKRGRGRV